MARYHSGGSGADVIVLGLTNPRHASCLGLSKDTVTVDARLVGSHGSRLAEDVVESSSPITSWFAFVSDEHGADSSTTWCGVLHATGGCGRPRFAEPSP